ncbi:ABC transporter substrate-binding protein [Sporosarcina sp. P33]|uniref:ABC transporter substrate-binding protein n=1 Tax=Sporosarcina sp. P33 TaxID=1930764 RepID=UPI0009BF0F62|nr:ABC transporter substrate-binding protein [Sporosarcina sp. P33]ARD47071.1 hypothetical protein SporoP33_01625 [Sporosarcina sp. P33]
MYRILFSLLLVFMIAGCSDDSGGSGSSSGESTLNIGYNAQPNTIDPHISNTATTTDVSRNIFEQLLSFDENNEVAPLLAESYEISEDGKDVTFKLRKDVKFHNGNEMTADDVVASMERWRSLNGKAIAYLSNSEFVKEDEDTVVLHMDKPLTIVKYILAMSSNFGAIMPKEVIEAADPATGVKEYIGTGPFKFVEWKQDQHIKLAKNEEYTSPSGEASGLVGKREPLVDTIYFHIVKDASTRAAGMQTGEYDLATQILTDNIEQLKTDSNLELHLDPASFLTSVFNKKKGLFTDQKAREAVNLAVNKEEIMTAAYTSDEYYDLEHGLMSENYPAWHNSPLFSVWAAVNRITREGKVLGPEQRCDVITALKSMTIYGAVLNFDEENSGSIEVGKRADFAVLEEDPTSIDPKGIKDIKVLSTFIDGIPVYGQQKIAAT